MLEALARRASCAGWVQAAVIGTPAGSGDDAVLTELGVMTSAVTFGTPELPLPVPGMSDVMPYPSTRFSEMDVAQLAAYRAAWSARIAEAVSEFAPDVIHANHVWIVGSLLKDVAPQVPVVTQCHATGLRQLELCPHLASDVIAGVRRNERFAVLHDGHADTLARVLDIEPDRIRVVGAGYREDIFNADGCSAKCGAGRLLYAGKYSASKGVPQLLTAFERLAARTPGLTLNVAGTGAGPEAEQIRRRMDELPGVVQHGQVDQHELAELMREADVFVLPSLYEGVPLVLVEALACGCRLVATELPGVVTDIAPRAGDALVPISVPELDGVDRLVPEAEEPFVADIERALAEALDCGAVRFDDGRVPEDVVRSIEPCAWSELFERIAAVWIDAIDTVAAAGGGA